MKRVVEDSVAGSDGRIRVNDHIVEVSPAIFIIMTIINMIIIIMIMIIMIIVNIMMMMINMTMMFQVNGISLVGVSQKLAAQTLSNCAICPETGL